MRERGKQNHSLASSVSQCSLFLEWNGDAEDAICDAAIYTARVTRALDPDGE